jgi:hypothetical protein
VSNWGLCLFDVAQEKVRLVCHSLRNSVHPLQAKPEEVVLKAFAFCQSCDQFVGQVVIWLTLPWV